MPDAETNAEYVAGLMAKIRDQATTLTAHWLIAIYNSDAGGEHKTTQIGTGFVVNHAGRILVVTAAHVLMGEEPATDKRVFLDGELRKIGEVSRGANWCSSEHDLAAFRIDLAEGLPSSAIAPVEDLRIVAVHGFLHRDFHRKLARGWLQPAPLLYTNCVSSVDHNLVHMSWPGGVNSRDTETQAIVTAPIPRGMSGSPMLDAAALHGGCVRVVGVFTDHKDGKGWGVAADQVLPFLNKLK